MSLFGMPIGCGHGSPENHLAFVKTTAIRGNTELLLKFLPRTDYGDAFFSVYRNNRRVRNLFAPEGQVTSLTLPITRGLGASSIVVLRLGNLGDPFYTNEEAARIFSDDVATRTTIKWEWPVETLGTPGNTDLTNWSLSGVKYNNTQHPPEFLTRGILRVETDETGGTITVDVFSGNVKVASGSASAGSTITLTAQNSSGITGTVDTDAGTIDSSGDDLFVRWPAKMQIKRGTSDPPTVIIATINFNQRDTGRFVEPSDLVANSYFYRADPQSDTDDDGDESVSVPITIRAVPLPPTNFQYSSGNSSAPVLSFTPSPTSGAKYNGYKQDIGGTPPNLNVPDATAIAGSTTITFPDVQPGGAGTARFWIRAEDSTGSFEEANGEVLEVEFDSGGTRVPLRPNQAALEPQSLEVTSGRTISIQCIYDAFGEAGIGSEMRLFSRTPSGSYNFGSAIDTKPLVNMGGGFKRATLTATLGSDGFFFITCKAATAAGDLSETQATEYQIFVSNVNAAAPVVEGWEGHG